MLNNPIRSTGTGEGRNETFSGYGNFDQSWNIEYQVGTFDFLRYFVGNLTGTGETATPYILTEDEFMDYTSGDDNGLKSFGLAIGSTDGSGTDDEDVLSGCVINTMGLNLDLGKPLIATLAGFCRKPESDTSASTFTPDTTKPWIFSQGNFKWNGTRVSRVTSATINAENNFNPEAGREIGSRFVEAAEPGLRKYGWTITVKMTSELATTIREDFYGGTGTPSTGVNDGEMVLRELSLVLSEGSATGDRNGLIQLDECIVSTISKPIRIDDTIVELTINGSAKKAKSGQLIKWWDAT